MADGRLTRMVHVLVHLGSSRDPVSSTTIAAMLNTNSAVVRRTMAPLREAGMVSSEDGRSGGWRLRTSLAELTVLDVQRAIHGDALIVPPKTLDHGGCRIEVSTNAAIGDAFRSAEEALSTAFANIKLSDIASAAERL